MAEQPDSTAPIRSESPFRGRGIGRSIVNWLVDRARERGITKIWLETTAEARRLYRDAGFNDMEDMMLWKH